LYAWIRALLGLLRGVFWVDIARHSIAVSPAEKIVQDWAAAGKSTAFYRDKTGIVQFGRIHRPGQIAGIKKGAQSPFSHWNGRLTTQT
jgi:hypothetical protein